MYIYIYVCTYIYIYVCVYVYIYVCVRVYIYIYLSRVVKPLNSSCTFRSNRGVRPGLDWSLVTSRVCEHGPFSSLIYHFCYEKKCYPHVKLGHAACNGPAVFHLFSRRFLCLSQPSQRFLGLPICSVAHFGLRFTVFCVCEVVNSNSFNHEFEFLNAKKVGNFLNNNMENSSVPWGYTVSDADHFLSMHCVPCVLCPRLRLLRVNSILT